MKFLKKYLYDDNGATAIEYGLIIAGISVAVLITMNGLGVDLNNFFGRVSNLLAAAATAAASP